MKKTLAAVTEEEKDEGLTLISLRATYVTLLEITRYPIDKQRVEQELSNCDLKIRNYWDRITEKYHIPLYIDRPMVIDSDNCLIYVNL